MRRFVIAGLLLSVLLPALSQAQVAPSRRYDIMDSLLNAEKADMNDLGRQGAGPQLMAYRNVLENDRKTLTTQLQPLFSPGPNGWVDCAAARQAMSKAMGIASTAAGLEAALVMGLRVERFHCQGVGFDANHPDWRQAVGQALINIQGRLPATFIQTRNVLGRTNASAILVAANARAFTPDSECLGKQLTSARAQNQRFQDAQRRAIEVCIPK